MKQLFRTIATSVVVALLVAACGKKQAPETTSLTTKMLAGKTFVVTDMKAELSVEGRARFSEELKEVDELKRQKTLAPAEAEQLSLREKFLKSLLAGEWIDSTFPAKTSEIPTEITFNNENKVTLNYSERTETLTYRLDANGKELYMAPEHTEATVRCDISNVTKGGFVLTIPQDKDKIHLQLRQKAL